MEHELNLDTMTEQRAHPCCGICSQFTKKHSLASLWRGFLKWTEWNFKLGYPFSFVEDLLKTNMREWNQYRKQHFSCTWIQSLTVSKNSKLREPQTKNLFDKLIQDYPNFAHLYSKTKRFWKSRAETVHSNHVLKSILI